MHGGETSMVIKRPSDIKPSEITEEKVYRQRRQFLKTSAHTTLTALAGINLAGLWHNDAVAALTLSNIASSPLSSNEKKTDFNDATSYNNFYEFSTDKEEPARLAKNFKTSPWTVNVDGEINKPARYHLEDLVKSHQLEERIYRLRCVEAWSMVIPWVGIPLRDVIKRFEPTSKAKYVEFTTLYDPEQMPGQRRRTLDWPYVEGLRMDEAMHPLTILAVGMYGQELPNQNGAPLRLVVPWKYGFKSIKSIISIRFTETQPKTTWALAGPGEYGFYANVNPELDHPRWSQSRERRIGEFFKRDTLMLNGYAEQVAHLYQGMDPKKLY
jgi:sulfoxide reductase catalytic subunit YedY